MTALKQISTEAKKIYAKGGTWKGAIKKASAHYRDKHAGKKSASAKRTRRKKVVGRVTVSESVVKRTFPGARVSNNSGVVSSASLISQLKQSYGQRIGTLESKKIFAGTKLEKRKIQKEINEIKAKLRKLC
jgi:hypothetical protein